MKRLPTISLVALALALAPFGLQPRADDAHHPGKVTKGKKNTSPNAKRSRKPPAKPKRASEVKAWPDPRPGIA